MNRIQQEQLNAKIEHRVNKFLQDSHITGIIQMHNGSISMMLPKNQKLTGEQQRAIEFVLEQEVIAFAKENDLEIACECGNFAKLYSLKELLHEAIKGGINSQAVEIDGNGKLDRSKQINEAVERVLGMVIEDIYTDYYIEDNTLYIVVPTLQEYIDGDDILEFSVKVRPLK